MSNYASFVRFLPSPVRSALRVFNARRQFLRYREEEWSWTPVIRKLVDTNDVVVDAGANLGYLTRLFAEWVGGSGKVYSFEPVPDTFGWLAKNVSMSKLNQVTPFPHGLSDVQTQVEMFIPAYDNGVENFYESHIATEGEVAEGMRKVTAIVAPLDQYAGQLDNLCLIKIDVEGHERAVVFGAEALISTWHPALLIEVQGEPGQRAETTAMWDRLAGHGYSPFIQRGEQLIPWTSGCGAVDVLFLRGEHQHKLGLSA